MDRITLNQKLLKLMLAMGDGAGRVSQGVPGFLEAAIPEFVNLLGCSGAAVLLEQDNGLNRIFEWDRVFPKSGPVQAETRSAYDQMKEAGGKLRHVVIRDTAYHHLFYLENYGVLELIRTAALDKETIGSLMPVMSLLAGTCYYLEYGPAGAGGETREMEELLSEKNRFMSNMRHEILTPLNVISGMIRLLRDTQLNETQINLLRNIDAASGSLLSTANDILDYRTIDSGQIELKCEPFQVKELFRHIFTANESIAESKGIILHYHLDPEIPEVLRGDARRIQQVLNSLLSNAIKFTETGTVEFSCRLQGTGEESIEVCFAVDDTGIGISPENLGKIFNHFQQEDDSFTRNHGGIGLGLSISRQLTELMGGKLEAASTKNRGSRFYFTISLGRHYEAPSPEADPVQAAETPSLHGISILLVEDNVFNQMLIEAILSRWGAACTIAEDGSKAVEIAMTEEFDLILMDIQMPVMDGFTAASIMRKELHLETPIIALTASVVKGVIEPFIKAGMQSCITKPFQEEELFSEIKTLLAATAEQRETEVARKKVKNVCDLSRLSKMVGNDPLKMSRMVEKFLEVTPESVQQLADFATSRDLEGISRSSHKLKSSIGLVATQPLRDLIATINEISQSGDDPSHLYDNINQFLEFFILLEDQLKVYLLEKCSPEK